MSLMCFDTTYVNGQVFQCLPEKDLYYIDNRKVSKAEYLYWYEELIPKDSKLIPHSL